MKTRLALIAMLAACQVHALPQVERLPLLVAKAEISSYNHASENHRISYAAATGSMKPHLKGGEALLMRKPLPGEDFTKGQLLVVPRWDKPNGIVHAVYKTSKTRLQTKGINCMYPDHWIDKNRVQWVVERVILITYSNQP